VSSGKWYAEVTLTGTLVYPSFGVTPLDLAPTSSYFGQQANSFIWFAYSGGGLFTGGSYINQTGDWPVAHAAGDIFGLALDMDNGTLKYYKNGTLQGGGNAFTGITGTQFFATSGYSQTENWNFGQNSWAYSAPSGYKALCTANLPDPTIADGSTAFDTKLYTGTEATLTISGYNFAPDLVWRKGRQAVSGSISETPNNLLFDTVRGAGKRLISNDTSQEDTGSTTLTAFTSDGFTLGSSTDGNDAPQTYVAWAWDAGSSTVTNTDGDITSSVRVNQAAGFSIVKWTSIAWTGSAANRQVGHGLNAAPSLIITKGMENVASWYTYHKDLDATNPNDYYLTLNTNNVRDTLADSFGPNIPDSTTFGDRLLGFSKDQEVIAYCFAPVEGYSAMGSYVGNGSTTDGPFVFTGMRPAFLLIKRTDVAADWCIFDKVRNGYNGDNDSLYPNSPNYENYFVLSNELDILSNGFRPVADRDRINTSAGNYIYVAFASHPFKTARAR
jgi:hypothetical protein